MGKFNFPSGLNIFTITLKLCMAQVVLPKEVNMSHNHSEACVF